MVAKNKLLGSGKPEEKVVERIVEVPKFERMWLYSVECPEGKIVSTFEEYNKLMDAGWVDHPGKCTKLPGHESKFDGEIGKVVEETTEESDVDESDK